VASFAETELSREKSAMFMNALLAMVSVVLFVYGSVCLASPKFAREYHLRFYRTTPPENWYDRLFYFKPAPLLLYRVLGAVLMGMSLFLLGVVYTNLHGLPVR
jgi:hypothetical protein